MRDHIRLRHAGHGHSLAKDLDAVWTLLLVPPVQVRPERRHPRAVPKTSRVQPASLNLLRQPASFPARQ
jgi:hypothetical protein